jgi:hypothetical protein
MHSRNEKLHVTYELDLKKMRKHRIDTIMKIKLRIEKYSQVLIESVRIILD